MYVFVRVNNMALNTCILILGSIRKGKVVGKKVGVKFFYALLFVQFLTVGVGAEQVIQDIWGHWRQFVFSQKDTIHGTLFFEDQVFPNSVQYLNLSIYRELILSPDGKATTTIVSIDSTKIFQAQGEVGQVDITDQLLKKKHDTIFQFDGFYYTQIDSLLMRTYMSIWMPGTPKINNPFVIAPLQFPQRAMLVDIIDNDIFLTIPLDSGDLGTVRLKRFAKYSLHTGIIEKITNSPSNILKGDLNIDGQVNFQDFLEFSQRYGDVGGGTTPAQITVERTLIDTLEIKYLSPDITR